MNNRSTCLRILRLQTYYLSALWPIVFGLPVPTDAQLAPTGGYEIARLGLTGNGYEYEDVEGMHHSSSVEITSVNASGQAAGSTSRYSPSGVSLGTDAWFYDGTSTHVLGLTGGDYQYENDDGLYRATDFEAFNNAGQVTGTSFRFSGPEDTFASLGRDAWFYDGQNTQQIGLLGGEYERDQEGGVHRFSTAYLLSDSGQAAGLSNRFGEDGESLGADAWISDGQLTDHVSLVGAGYEAETEVGGTFRYSRPHALNSAGQLTGASTRFGESGINLGVDAWLRDGGGTHILNLTGSGYDVISDNEIAHHSEPLLMAESGEVVGFSYRYSSEADFLGRDAWIYNGTSTQAVGLTGGAYEYGAPTGNHRVSFPLALNDVGQAAGVTTRLIDQVELLGQDVWFYDGTTSQLVSLTGIGYETLTVDGAYRVSSITSALAMNNAGHLAGISVRYHEMGFDVGQAGWFYDASTGVTTPLEFSVRDSDGFSYTEPQLVTEEGVVLGLYELFDGGTSLGNRLFWWSLDEGFHDLSDLVDGGLTAAGWQILTGVVRSAGSVAGGAPQYIIGTGSIIGQAVAESPFDFEGESIFLLTAIPGQGLPGDYNDDGVVNAADYVVWRNNNGQSVSLPNDTTPESVTQADYDVWVDNFGMTANGAVVNHAVPEPTTSLLLLTVTILWLAGRLRHPDHFGR